MTGAIESCPVTIISGFLGAGKTTLLRRIIKEAHGKRVAVIQNEFSDEMGIESPLMLDAEGKPIDGFYELPNGCMCCSVRDSLVSTLESLLKERHRFDHILLETSGVADPEPLAKSFWLDEGLQSRLRLDGIITVVDAQNFKRCLVLSQEETKKLAASHEDGDAFASLILKLKSSNHASEEETQSEQIELENGTHVSGLALETAKQVACASLLLINKTDLVPTTQIDMVERLMSEMNPTAAIVRTRNCEVPIDSLLGLQAFELSSRGFEAAVECSHCSNSAHTSCPKHSHHERGPLDIGPCLLRLECAQPPLSKQAFERIIAQLLWESAVGKVYRCKGLIVAVDEDDDVQPSTPQLFMLQGVGEVFEVAPLSKSQSADYLDKWRGREFGGKLLFVGRGIRLLELESRISACTRVGEF